MSSGNTVYHSDWNKNDYIRLQRQHYQLFGFTGSETGYIYLVSHRFFPAAAYIYYTIDDGLKKKLKKKKKINFFWKKGWQIKAIMLSYCHKVKWGGNNIKKLIIRLDDDLHQKLKLISVYDSEPIQKIVEQLIKDYVNQKQLPNNKK